MIVELLLAAAYWAWIPVFVYSIWFSIKWLYEKYTESHVISIDAPFVDETNFNGSFSDAIAYGSKQVNNPSQKNLC